MSVPFYGFQVFTITLVGDVVARDGGRLPDTLDNHDFISRFRRSENPILFYDPTPRVTTDIYSINSAGFRDY